jgi:hypothetical protein
MNRLDFKEDYVEFYENCEKLAERIEKCKITMIWN